MGKRFGHPPEGKLFHDEVLLYTEGESDLALGHYSLLNLADVNVQYCPTRSGPALRFCYDKQLKGREHLSDEFKANITPVIKNLNSEILNRLFKGDNSK